MISLYSLRIPQLAIIVRISLCPLSASTRASTRMVHINKSFRWWILQMESVRQLPLHWRTHTHRVTSNSLRQRQRTELSFYCRYLSTQYSSTVRYFKWYVTSFYISIWSLLGWTSDWNKSLWSYETVSWGKHSFLCHVLWYSTRISSTGHKAILDSTESHKRNRSFLQIL